MTDVTKPAFGRGRSPVTFLEAYRAAKDIGTATLRGMDRRDAAALVAATALKAKGLSPESPGIDWEALIDFIERIMPLLLMLIDLFT